MATLRCSMCSIDYPHNHRHMRCSICGEQTSFFSNVPHDPDWADTVRLARDARPHDDQPTSDVGYADARSRHDPQLNTEEQWWRALEMYRAGFPYDVALSLALRDDVDLHRACDLVKKAGPDMALAILD